MKKTLALLLAVLMVVGMFAGCKNSETKPTDPTKDTEASGTQTDPSNTDPTDPGATTEPTEPIKTIDGAPADYDANSTTIYNDVLAEFKAAYDKAENTENVSERYALMAVAEAKLLEAAVMLPNSSNGGNYSISRVAPYTNTPVLWGNDAYRFHDRVVTDKPLTTADRDEIKKHYVEVEETSDEYMAWVKEFLTGKGYAIKDEYNMAYSSEPQTWDVLATSQAADSEAIINTYDGLVEYDMKNELKGALAESWEVSADGLTYTFHLRKGLKWVDSQGREVADVKADDFVAGMQHMCDAVGGLEYLVDGLIVNANEYMTGKADFSEVGVSAPDDYTVVYTLVKPTSYFITMLGYGVFAPMSRSYYESQGGKFGADFNAGDPSYSYGKTPDNIAYCGPYRVTSYVSENSIVFDTNESYWNKDGINLKKITWLYNDGQDATKAYNDMKNGVIDGCGLNASALQVAKEDGWFDQYHYVSGTDATSFMIFLNVNRIIYSNASDISKVVSAKNDAQKTASIAALKNVHFRRAIMMSVDRASYNAQTVGEELKLTSLRNSYVPGNFVKLIEEVTIDINGTPKTYPAGTNYGQIVQDQIDADGVLPVKVYDPTADEGAGSSDAFDGWYNVEAAKSELAKAIEELTADGVEISAENPIVLDLPYFSASEVYTNRAHALKQSVEEALEGKVIVNLVECQKQPDWFYAGYWTTVGYESNYDAYDLSGWGPDYGDPATYLNTFLPDYSGYMTKCIGLF